MQAVSWVYSYLKQCSYRGLTDLNVFVGESDVYEQKFRSGIWAGWAATGSRLQGLNSTAEPTQT